MAALQQNLTIQRGSTFQTIVRWETTPVVYKTITDITKAAPPVITAAGHSVPDGWRVAVSAVEGMRQINAKGNPPRASDYHQATLISANTLSLNEVNAAGYSTYTSGGVLQYNTPVDLANYTARMKIKNRVGGTLILELTTENSRIALDNTNKTITLTLTAAVTAALTATHGVYDLEMVSAAGVVTKIIEGKVAFKDEVTTT